MTRPVRPLRGPDRPRLQDAPWAALYTTRPHRPQGGRREPPAGSPQRGPEPQRGAGRWGGTCHPSTSAPKTARAPSACSAREPTPTCSAVPVVRPSSPSCPGGRGAGRSGSSAGGSAGSGCGVRVRRKRITLSSLTV